APREQRTDSPLVVAASSGIRLFGKGCAPSSMQDRLANLASLGSLFVTHWPSCSAAWLSWLRSSVNQGGVDLVDFSRGESTPAGGYRASFRNSAYRQLPGDRANESTCASGPSGPAAPECSPLRL